MDTTTLQKANILNQQIKDFTEALNCFEYQPYSDHERFEEKVSTNPRLIIEYDNDGREQIELPMELNEILVDFLKSAIKEGLETAIQEFNAL